MSIEHPLDANAIPCLIGERLISRYNDGEPTCFTVIAVGDNLVISPDGHIFNSDTCVHQDDTSVTTPLLPDNIQWPRFEDNTLVALGDWFINRNDVSCPVNRIWFRRREDDIVYYKINRDSWMPLGAPVKRGMPVDTDGAADDMLSEANEDALYIAGENAEDTIRMAKFAYYDALARYSTALDNNLATTPHDETINAAKDIVNQARNRLNDDARYPSNILASAAALDVIENKLPLGLKPINHETAGNARAYAASLVPGDMLALPFSCNVDLINDTHNIESLIAANQEIFDIVRDRQRDDDRDCVLEELDYYKPCIEFDIDTWDNVYVKNRPSFDNETSHERPAILQAILDCPYGYSDKVGDLVADCDKLYKSWRDASPRKAEKLVYQIDTALNRIAVTMSRDYTATLDAWLDYKPRDLVDTFVAMGAANVIASVAQADRVTSAIVDENGRLTIDCRITTTPRSK